MFQQVVDFRDESDALFRLIAALDNHELARTTQFKDWTIDDVIRHLHVWNCAAELSLTNPNAFLEFFEQVKIAMAGGALRGFERDYAGKMSGRTLVREWQGACANMAAKFADADPKARVQWAGPDMSVLSSITARLMETWAHGQEIYDCLGVDRVDTDRIRNIAVLGVNTFGWTFRNRGLKVPASVPGLRLTAPSGEIWEWRAGNEDDFISGPAAGFCQVVTQVRNIADTALTVTGPIATEWMAIAQCFAGPPEDPPAAGRRFRIRAE